MYTHSCWVHYSALLYQCVFVYLFPRCWIKVFIALPNVIYYSFVYLSLIRSLKLRRTHLCTTCYLLVSLLLCVLICILRILVYLVECEQMSFCWCMASGAQWVSREPTGVLCRSVHVCTRRISLRSSMAFKADNQAIIASVCFVLWWQTVHCS